MHSKITAPDCPDKNNIIENKDLIIKYNLVVRHSNNQFLIPFQYNYKTENQIFIWFKRKLETDKYHGCIFNHVLHCKECFTIPKGLGKFYICDVVHIAHYNIDLDVKSYLEINLTDLYKYIDKFRKLYFITFTNEFSKYIVTLDDLSKMSDIKKC